ncbi:eukaryotic translation initiation factor (iso) 4E [Artemisia annua]|uniref:Eukaryotic translation initiation factor isoform 4E n=1 Tax=Artemisia annua TaxID=35608 RepID=A0A2U1NPG5_ARTAN|nr:eukaryotic translation initiation factor (iso) 4E [Artemisia annua]
MDYGWVVILPSGSRRLTKPYELELAIYSGAQVFKPSKLPGNADFHMFKAGIEPKWEDPEYANGGKWTVTSSRKAGLETMWSETLMALIGEQFDDADEICGVVASVRQRQDKLSLWTKNAANETAQDARPRTIIPLGKAHIDEPNFNRPERQ